MGCNCGGWKQYVGRKPNDPVDNPAANVPKKCPVCGWPLSQVKVVDHATSKTVIKSFCTRKGCPGQKGV